MTQSTARPIWFSHVFAAATAFIWSFSYIHIIWLAEYVTPLQLVILRNLFFLPGVIALWIMRRPTVRGRSTAQWLIIIAVGCASGPLYHYPVAWGGDEGRTNASLIGLIIATVPVHVGWLAWLLLREPLTLRRILGLVLGLLGVMTVLAGHLFDDAITTTTTLMGVLAVVASAIIGGLNTVATRAARRSLHPLDLLCLAGTVGIIIALALTPFADVTSMSAIPLLGWWASFYLGFIAIAVAYACWYTALGGSLPAVSIAMYLFVPCVLSALWAWLWQDNHIGWEFFVGAALVLAGLLAGMERRPEGDAEPTAIAAARERTHLQQGPSTR
ncbi:MAG: DMT family transporter [Phycisphaerales bacterium]